MRLPCNWTHLTLSGTTCYCANFLSIAPCNSPGSSACSSQLSYPMECTSPCSGDSSYQCGNALVLNLYASIKSPIPIIGRAELPSSSSANSVALMSNTNSATPTSSTGTPMVTTSTPYPGTTSASTSSDNGYSTSTIYETQLITITSCAPTITHCPARNTSLSMVSRPVAIVIYSTEWITISSCAPVVTDCPYRVSTGMVPVTTVTLHGNPPSPTPKGNTMMPTAIPTPGNGGVVPGNGTAPSNSPISIVSGATGNGLVWSSFVAVGFVFVGVFWA